MSVLSPFRRHGRHAGSNPFPEPEETLPEALAKLPPGHPVHQPLPPQPHVRGLHPFVAPLLSGPRRGGSRHTEPFRPEFAEEGELARPYAPVGRPLRPWLVPDTFRRKPGNVSQQGVSAAEFVRERLTALSYPAPGARPSEMAAFMRRVSVITGTRSSFEQAARCVAWAPALEAPASVTATGPQRRLTGPQFTPHAAGRAA